MKIYKHLETTGNVLKMAESRNMSDSELARGLGVTPQAVNKWRNCGGGLSKSMLVCAAQFFNVKVDDILVAEERQDVLFLCFLFYADGSSSIISLNRGSSSIWYRLVSIGSLPRLKTITCSMGMLITLLTGLLIFSETFLQVRESIPPI